MKKLFKFFFLLIVSILGFSLFYPSKVLAQSCTGYGICCSANTFRCAIGGDFYQTTFCNNPANIGKTCTYGPQTGYCQCTSSYTRTCNLSLNCVSNNCGAGDYLIDDFCYPNCATSDQGCGAFGCPSNTKRICTNCGSGWVCSCVYNASCVSTPSPTVPPCDATSPANLTLSEVGSNLWYLTWTKGSNGTKQLVFVDTSKANVESNCVSSVCFLENTNVDVNTESYSLSGLSEGTIYYARIVTYKDASCSSNSSTLTDISSCDVSPSSVFMNVGDTASLIASVNSSGEVDRVTFTPSSGFISLNPLSDSSYPYSSKATAVSVGTGTVALNVLNASSVSYCSSISDINVLVGDPWWQVIDGDVQTNGSLTSDVPSGYYFNLDGPGGFPGVVKYALTTDLTSSNVSSKGWLANSPYLPVNNRTLNYTYFRRIVPFETTLNTISSDSVAGSSFESGGVISDGYYWYEYDGSVTGFPLTITGDMSLPNGRSVVLLVSDASLNIQGDITFTSGLSSLVILVNGDIAIDGDVVDLQGFMLADGDVSTGSSANALNFKGSIAAQGSINLQRDLGDLLNPTTPSEVFEYDPSSVFLFPPALSIKKTRWKEVAP